MVVAAVAAVVVAAVTPPATAQTATTDTRAGARLGCDREVQTPAMPYEPGSPECRVLIDCKSQIESMLMALSRLDDSEAVRQQLREVHNQLEALHALHRRSAS